MPSSLNSNKVNAALVVALVILCVQVKFQRDYLDTSGVSLKQQESEAPFETTTSNGNGILEVSRFDESSPKNRVYISRSPRATPSCISIADSSKIDFERLFYLEFADGELNSGKEWVENGCPDTFFDVYVADEGMGVRAERKKGVAPPAGTASVGVVGGAEEAEVKNDNVVGGGENVVNSR